MNANSSIPIYEWLSQARTRLEKTGVDSARLDSLVLLSDELGRDKAWLLAHDEEELTPDAITILGEKVALRARHVPLAYIRGKTEFYGREFAVTNDVLVPRPESEAMLDLLKDYSGNDGPVYIFDIGTGSGCLGISAALEVPNAKVYATDIDKNCLSLAAQNATSLGADVRFLQGDLLQPLRKISLESLPYILLCNLPYVPDGYPINEAAGHEPKLALFSGLDGLDHYRKLFAEANTLAVPPAIIITESLKDQHHALASLAREHSYILEKSEDLAQMFAWDGKINR